eukprot:c21504_g1_i1 orf=333-701(-)
MGSRQVEEMQSLLGISSSSFGQLAVGNRKPTMMKVVVLKVDLHCQGCVRRVRKAVSKLEGVDSYHLDLDKEKVTVIGKVNPKVVLQRVSKIRAAEFWPTNQKLGQSSDEDIVQPFAFGLAPV